MRQRSIVGGLVCAAAALLLTACSNSTQSAGTSPTSGPTSGGGGDQPSSVAIKVLSNRADLISGDDALVELVLPSGTDLSTVKTDVDERDISSSFALRANGHVEGLVTDLLENQPEVLTVKLADGSGAHITITNHPIGGPVFAGAQVQPWTCAAGAIDTKCNQPTVYNYEYKSSKTGKFADYNPAKPPDDLATTTTDQNVTVPYIIRVEVGHMDRGQYQIAVLFDPIKDWQPWAPQTGWNGKVITTGGYSCGSHHGEGLPPTVVVDDPLSRGFAVMSSSLFDNNQNCNMVVQAEAIMMLKEHFIETYGPIRYTIATGCSGGSIYQQQNANGYPGLFDGIIPQCSFPDSVTTATEVEDCALLMNYWQNPIVTWTTEQKVAVTGHPKLTTCQAWIAAGFNAAENPELVPTSVTQNCGVTAEEAWSPTNPTGVRCNLIDYMISIVGTRTEDGYAKNPINNTGVQYGLSALIDGSISLAQFLDLNASIGSHNINYQFQTQRSDADMDVLPTGYQGGLINEGSLMAGVPIIDLRGHDTLDIHLDYHSWEMRERLKNANGGYANQVIWLSPKLLAGEPTWPSDSLTVMDQWLAAIEADHRNVPLATKVADDKPATAVDRCYDNKGKIVGAPDSRACKIAPYSKNPRMVAGESVSNDNYRCQLKPLDHNDYLPVTFSTGEWGLLQQIFPDGVCDYSKPGIGQQATLPWQGYANGPGGQPLGDAPVSVPLGS